MKKIILILAVIIVLIFIGNALYTNYLNTTPDNFMVPIDETENDEISDNKETSFESLKKN